MRSTPGNSPICPKEIVAADGDSCNGFQLQNSAVGIIFGCSRQNISTMKNDVLLILGTTRDGNGFQNLNAKRAFNGPWQWNHLGFHGTTNLEFQKIGHFYRKWNFLGVPWNQKCVRISCPLKQRITLRLDIKKLMFL